MRAAPGRISAAALALALLSLDGASSDASFRELEREIAAAESRLQAEDYAAARSAAERLLARLAPGAPARLVARAELLLGASLERQGERAAGERALARALALARASSAGFEHPERSDLELESHARLALGLAAWSRAEYDAATREAGAALELARVAGAGEPEGDSRWLLGATAYKRGRYADAEREFGAALAACESADAPRCAGRALEGTGLAALDRRAYGVAETSLTAALERFVLGGDAHSECRVLAEIAVLHLFEGRPEEARDWALRSLARAVEAGERPAEARARQVLGNAERDRGRAAEAASQLAAAAALRRETGDPREEAWALAGRARALARTGELDGARAELVRALDAWRRLVDRRALAWHLLVLARLDLDRGEPGRAEASLGEAARLAAAIELPYASEIHLTWAGLEAARGAPQAAVRRARDAVDAARRTTNDEMLWGALVGLAAAQARVGAVAPAAAALDEALGRLERLRGEALPDDESRIAAIDRRLDAFELAIEALFELGRGAEALVVSERARARVLLDRLGARPVPARAAVAELARRGGIELLEFFVGERASYAWFVARSGAIEARALPVTRAELEPLVAAAAGIADADEAARREARVRLSAVLLGPFAAALANPPAPLAVAAHGPLVHLPFAALPDASGRPLVERHALFVVPSFGFLAAPPRAGGGDGCLLLADPEPPPIPGRDRPLPRLPGARREAEAIARLFPARSATLLVGEAASEERLRALAPRARVLHVAAHGLPDDDHPLAGRLALAASGAGDEAETDGLWSAREALDLGLAADLVVLSGCSAARGRLSGEGALGFGFALLGAGAQAVVASLGRVPDAIGGFQMERFYRELVGGADAAEALRSAQLATRAELRSGRFRGADGRPLGDDPLLWAPFVLVGRAGAATPARAGG